MRVWLRSSKPRTWTTPGQTVHADFQWIARRCRPPDRGARGWRSRRRGPAVGGGGEAWDGSRAVWACESRARALTPSTQQRHPPARPSREQLAVVLHPQVLAGKLAEDGAE